MYKDDFLEAMKGVKQIIIRILFTLVRAITLKKCRVFFLIQVVNRLAKRTVPNRLLYIGEIVSGGKEIKPKMDELVTRYIQI